MTSLSSDNTAGSENVYILRRKPFMYMMQHEGPRTYTARYLKLLPPPQSEKKIVSIVR
jgi:hypothetical protein